MPYLLPFGNASAAKEKAFSKLLDSFESGKSLASDSLVCSRLISSKQREEI